MLLPRGQNEILFELILVGRVVSWYNNMKHLKRR